MPKVPIDRLMVLSRSSSNLLQTVFNLDAAREFAVPAFTGPLTVAVGAEARHEKYSIGAGDEASYTGSGSQGFAGFRPANAGSHSRHNESIYVNLEAEVTKKLSGGVALRHERYSDFGNTTSAKGSVKKWEFDLGWAWIKVFS